MDVAVSARPGSSSCHARVAAVLLNYRTPELVRAALPPLIEAIDPAQDTVVVVDNDSRDGSYEQISDLVRERDWKDVRLLQTGANRGFAAGNNAGIRAVPARAYLLLNSDTLVRAGAVSRLWNALQADPRLGIVGPRLEWPDGTPQVSCFRLHTPMSEFVNAAGTGLLTRAFANWDVPLPASDATAMAEWTSFAAVMIRREVIEEVGLLDEGYFMYFEDVDFCRATREAGWQIGHEPSARVVHLRGGSSPVKSLKAARKRRPRYYYQSRSRYFRKRGGRRTLVGANLAWSLGRCISAVRELLGSKQRHTVDNELFDVWRG